MSDEFTLERLQLKVETEELGAAFSPDRTRVLTAADRTVLLWDVETGHSLRTPARTRRSQDLRRECGVDLRSAPRHLVRRERRHSGMERI